MWHAKMAATHVGETSGKLSRPVIKIKPLCKQARRLCSVSRPAVRGDLQISLFLTASIHFNRQTVLMSIFILDVGERSMFVQS